MKKSKVLLGMLALVITLISCSKKDGSSGSVSTQERGENSAIPRNVANLFNGTTAPATDFRYELNAAGDGVVITGYLGKGGGVLIIPSEIEGFPVVEFRGSITFQNKKITAVVFPDSITKMSLGTFPLQPTFADDTLIAVKFPKEVSEIIKTLFSGCANLATVILPESVEKIGDSAFKNTGITSIVLPAGIKEIDNGAFSGCKQLTSVTIPESIEVIGNTVFSGCSELTEVTLPSKQIRYAADLTFLGCSKLSLATRKTIQDTGYTGSF